MQGEILKLRTVYHNSQKKKNTFYSRICLILVSLLKDQNNKTVLNYVRILSTATKEVMISDISE